MNNPRVFLLVGMLVSLAACGGSGSGTSSLPAFYTDNYASPATFYTGYDTGACGFGTQTNTYVTAVNTAIYNSAAVCGAYIEVTGDKGTVVVKVVDECPSTSPPCATTHLDLSTDAYNAVTSSISGPVDVTWKFVEAPIGSSPIVLYWGSALSQWYLDVVVDVIRHPVSTVEVKDSSGTFVPMTRTSNHFSASATTNTFPDPIVIRFTDMFGKQVEDTVTWASSTTSTTTVQFPAYQ